DAHGEQRSAGVELGVAGARDQRLACKHHTVACACPRIACELQFHTVLDCLARLAAGVIGLDDRQRLRCTRFMSAPWARVERTNCLRRRTVPKAHFAEPLAMMLATAAAQRRRICLLL